MRIPAGAWLPDRPSLTNGGLPVVRNCIADNGFYRPMNSFQQINENTLAADPRGMFAFRRDASTWLLLYGGGTKIYEIASRTTAPVDRSRDAGTYTMNPGDRWRGLQFGNSALITNWSEPIQIIDTINPTAFADLGSTDVMLPPRARYIANVRGRVMVGYTYDPVDEEQPSRVWWHGFTNGLPDLEAWASSQETTADFQDITGLGPITGLTGGEFGTVLCENGISRVVPGGSFTFQFDTVSDNVGCTIPASVIRYGAATFFFSREGWQVFNGAGTTPIGNGRIDRWFANDFDVDHADKMWAAPVGGIDGTIAWIYCGAGNAGVPNRMLTFNTKSGLWSWADVDLEMMAPTVTFGGDLDDEDDERWDDLDAFAGDLDDPALWSRLVRIGGVRDGSLQALTGTPVSAVFQSPEFEMAPGYQSALNKIVTLRTSGAVGTEIGKREHPSTTPVWTGSYGEEDDGVVRCREPAKFHTVRATLTDWSDFQGWDVDGVRMGGR